MENETPGFTWLIEHTIPKGELLIVQSPSHVGRSLLLLDWALCHATGKSWFGHLTQPGSVAFCSSEQLQNLTLRARAWYNTYESEVDISVPQTPISFFELGTLTNDNYFLAAEQLIEEIADQADPPSLIILDVLANDERKARVLAYRLWQQFGATVLLTSCCGSHENMFQLLPFEHTQEQKFVLRFPDSYGASSLHLRLQSVPTSGKSFPLSRATSYIMECDNQQTA